MSALEWFGITMVAMSAAAIAYMMWRISHHSDQAEVRHPLRPTPREAALGFTSAQPKLPLCEMIMLCHTTTKYYDLNPLRRAAGFPLFSTTLLPLQSDKRVILSPSSGATVLLRARAQAVRRMPER